jgi:tRNA1Val (adenine37-N6)-methyltransferase
MGAPSFSFKQFTVFHDKCAMKVGTDGVLLGAWADVSHTKAILDIGTGSGLIALMLAQRSEANIIAIEIDKNAVEQAAENVANSPWSNRIIVKEQSFMEFAKTTTQKFDRIVCNPPFFVKSLKTPNESRTIARHASENLHNELLVEGKKLICEQGRICLILPVNEGNACVAIAAKNGLHCVRKTIVFAKPNIDPKRLLLEFSDTKCELQTSELIIETNERHIYGPDFIQLVKDFYLKL